MKEIVRFPPAPLRDRGRSPYALSVLRLAFADFLAAHHEACRKGQPLLTGPGESYLRERLRVTGRDDAQSPPVPCLLPCWEAAARRLWLGGTCLKEFRQPAPNQTRLLDVFQEQDWVAHIDDPLWLEAGEGEEDAKRRLNETIKNLNRGLPPRTIRFHGDGTGQGVRWEHDHRGRRARRLLT